MSQAGRYSDDSYLPDIETLTGDAGGAIGPDGAFNVDLLGGANITATGTPNTITFDVTGTTDNALQIGNATGSLTSIAVGLTGTIVTGVTGADPVWTTATYPATAAIGDVIYGSALNTITGLVFDATATRYLANTGTGATLPEWNQVNLTNGVTGILPVANGGTGLADLDVDNVLYVTKSGNDANTGRDINHAKLTIQAAVTAAAVGDTILVYPGTYTETVTHAANNVTVMAQGKPSNCIITQADANVINFNTRTGILYLNFGISCTAATTAINTVEGSTGTAVFKQCHISMNSATAIVAAAQPAIGAITGAGELSVRFGIHTYTHTGACGGTALKGAFNVANGGMIHLDYLHEINITNSGTALATGVGIDTASTGSFVIHDCGITVTDPNATNVVGLAYLGGTGADHEYYRNEVHVIVTNNIGYGFFSGDTATTSRFFYNHIHVTDVAGTSYSFAVGNTATVISHFDDIVAADGVQIVAGGIFTEVSSEIDGDLTNQSLKAAGTVQHTISNTDNTAAASNAAVNISVGGTTSTGDPYTKWLITGSTAFSAGIDNSDSDAFKIGPNVNPSTGNSDFEIAAATGAITFNEAYTFPVADGGANEVLTTNGAGVVSWQAGGGGGGGLTWEVTTVNDSIVEGEGYHANKGTLLTMTLPATGAIGDTFAITNMNIAVGWRIAQNANQYIRFGNQLTTVGVGGYLESTALGDSVELVCNVSGASTGWIVVQSVGNITIV